MFVFSAKVNRWRDLLMLQAQEHFDDAEHSCRCCCMTDVGFQRTDRTKAPFGGELVESMGECLDLYRVSQFGGRPMCLDILKVTRIDVMSSIDGFLQLALRLKTGNGDAGSLTVLIGSTRLD